MIRDSIRIRIKIDTIELDGELYETACGRAVAEILPLEGKPHGWGDEFYFEIPLSIGHDETATSSVAVGDIGYWPPGNALAIFFGPTPLSSGIDPVPAGDVSIVGRIIGDAALLRKARNPGRISIERA